MMEQLPDLSQAQATFVVANTPLFLMRKLRSDPAVATIARNNDGSHILDWLRQASARAPDNERDLILPYVFLVALSLQNDLSPLKEAAAITVSFADWYKYIAQYLVDSITPTDRRVIKFTHELTPAKISTESSSATQKLVLG